MGRLTKGLGDLWDPIKASLEELVECYERVNRVTSLGQIGRLRRQAVREARVENGVILDAGAGPGFIGLISLDMGARTVFLLDPIERMIEEQKRNLEAVERFRYESLQGVFESLPFKDSSLDAVITSFALRDAYDLDKAVSEIARVLKPSGSLVILDFYKPSNKLWASLIGLYLKYGIPFLSRIAGCRKSLLYKGLYETYKKHLTGNEYMQLLSRHFEQVEIKTRMMKSVMIAVARNPLHKPLTHSSSEQGNK